MKKILSIILVSIVCSNIAFGAVKTSDFVNVTQIRSITSGNVYFSVDKIAICNTTEFLIKVIDDGSKTFYSTLLAASMSGKKVKLETWGECAAGTGWGTEIQSIYVRF